ncbi:MAG: alpha/beta hydrolase family protein [Dehalococcoidia bacterium]
MIAVTATLPDDAALRASVVLVHGAANSASVWTYWQRALAEHGFASYAVDLRGHGASDPVDLSRTSMRDYVDDVVNLINELGGKRDYWISMGWSMGGLVAMQAAYDQCALAFVGLAPSTPALARDASMPLREGVFGIEEYGITDFDPDADQPAMVDLDQEERAIALASRSSESRYARDERAAGVVVSDLDCPSLIVTSTGDTQWPRSRYDSMHLPVEHLSVEGASHWGLVLNRRVIEALVPRVVAWIDGVAPE